MEIEIEVKVEQDAYQINVKATDGVTNRVFLSHEGETLIRICEGKHYSITKGISLEEGYAKVISKTGDEDLSFPTSQGLFPKYIDPEDVIIQILRERKKIIKFLTEGGDKKITYKFKTVSSSYSSEEEEEE
jgi:hypothetical protein